MPRVIRERIPVTIECGPGLTEQSHKKQCDINYILKGYAKTGLIQHAHKHEGKYDDYSGIDFQTAQNIVAEAKSMFEALPALVRQEFGHDVARFLDFARDPENGKKMEEMGITPGVDGIDANGQLIQSINSLVETLAPSEAANTDGGESPDGNLKKPEESLEKP